MFHVLLCDDEPAVTNFLSANIPWESMGIDSIFTASDGTEALSCFESTQIHLLITDIRMPRMDGLTLLEHVRARYPDTHCVLLTAYGEFEYAKTALRLGVDNYLMKPIQIEELMGTIENAVENMYLSRKNKEELFRENILRRWLTGTISEDELSERSNYLDDINVYQSSYMAVCIRKTDAHFSLSAFTQMCMEKLKAHCNCLSVWDNQGRYVFIISGKDLQIEEIQNILLQTALSVKVEKNMQIALGLVVHKNMELAQSYQGAVKILDETDANSQMFIQSATSSASPEPNSGFSYDALSPIVQKALEYIHEKYAQGVSIRDFCSGYAITPAYLGYLFKKETNMFFNNYLNQYRLSRAAVLLSETQERVNVIAEKTGFTTTSYFITSFKKYTGMSPQKYREKQYYETAKD